MKLFFDELHDNYDVLNMEFEEVVELNEVLNSCKLPQKRVFNKIKMQLEVAIASKKLPKKKNGKGNS